MSHSVVLGQVFFITMHTLVYFESILITPPAAVSAWKCTKSSIEKNPPKALFTPV